MDKYDFITMILNRRDVSINDKKRGIILATQELDQRTTTSGIDENGSEKERKHAPKDTASFLSLFNDPKGFKFLTHDFDPESQMPMESFLAQVRDTFRVSARKYTIPPSLFALMDVFINGGVERKWKDAEGVSHEENYASPSWIDLAKSNPNVHLINDNSCGPTIQAFRRTIRLVKPALNDIVKNLNAKHPDFEIKTKSLERADFYTNVAYLEKGVERILKDMSQYQDFLNISITYKKDTDKRIIRITQEESKTSNIEEVLKKFKNGGGAFNEISKVLRGYCNWSVEALWDEVPKRWNILNDSDAPEVEDIDASGITGFTHVLTYYSK